MNIMGINKNAYTLIYRIWGVTWKISWIALLMLSFSSLSSACAPQTNQAPIRIRVPTDSAFKKGYDLWRQAVNQRGGLLGHPVELDNSAQLNLEFGPFTPSDAGSLKLSPVETAPALNLFVVSPQRTLESFASFVLALPLDDRPKTAAYLTTDVPLTRAQVDQVKKRLSKGGVKTVFEAQPYPVVQSNDVSPLAQQIVRAHPDVVILGTAGVNDCVQFIRAFQQQRFNPKAFIATTGPDERSNFLKAIGMASAEGVLVSGIGWWPGASTFQNDQFTKDYLATYGGTVQDISAETVQAYAVGQVLEQAVSQAKSLDTRVLIKTLRDSSFTSVFGGIKLNETGENTIGVPFLFQWQHGKLIPVYPDLQALANPEYPKTSWV
jgi:branched-chain amino acid transport system substrate-binding protein